MGAIWYQFDWTLLKEPHLRDVEIALFSFSSETFLNRYRLLFSREVYAASSAEGEWTGGEVLM